MAQNHEINFTSRHTGRPTHDNFKKKVAIYFEIYPAQTHSHTHARHIQKHELN